jgi:MFS family permease
MLIFGDALGRRKGIIIGAAIMILGAAIQALSFKGHNATAQFIIGRVVTGFGNGMSTATIPTYQAECSRTKNHGLLICIEGGIIAFGTLIAYWIDFGCSYGSDALSWRFPIAFQSVFGAILLLGMIWLPESPRWLLTKDRHEDAAKVIAALRGNGVDDEETRFEAHIIMDSIRASGHKGGITPFSSLFTNGKTQHFRRMMLGASSQLMQQIGGCNAVIYYCGFEPAVPQ